MEQNNKMTGRISGISRLTDFFRMKVFYQILFVMLIMIVFLGIQAYMNLRIITTMQQRTKALSGVNTYRLNQISTFKQDIAKLQIAYLEALQGGNPGSFTMNLNLLEQSSIFLWLDPETKRDLLGKLGEIKRLLHPAPNWNSYQTLKNVLFELWISINGAESRLSTTLVQSLVNNDRFLNESKMNGISIGMISALFLLVLGIIIVNSIFTPLQKLIRLMHQVAEGNFAVRFKERRNDEFGVVMNGFNHMIDNIAAMQQSIRQHTADLESKNIEMERFIYTVSHDLQSPLITISGFAGSIIKDLDKGKTDRLAPDMKRIETAATKMQQLLRDLLELSRIGRFVNPSSDFSLTEVAVDVIELLQGIIEANGVSVSVMPDMPQIRGDRQRIAELLQNLIENAIKFTAPVKGPRVQIGCFYPENRPVFFVKDNGPGIDPAYHQKVFGLFDKLEQNTAGNGIGLAIVKRIVELHKGRVWIESSPGNGATFFFTLNESES